LNRNQFGKPVALNGDARVSVAVLQSRAFSGMRRCKRKSRASFDERRVQVSCGYSFNSSVTPLPNAVLSKTLMLPICVDDDFVPALSFGVDFLFSN
jgi:hypothetical protein